MQTYHDYLTPMMAKYDKIAYTLRQSWERVTKQKAGNKLPAFICDKITAPRRNHFQFTVVNTMVEY